MLAPVLLLASVAGLAAAQDLPSPTSSPAAPSPSTVRPPPPTSSPVAPSPSLSPSPSPSLPPATTTAAPSPAPWLPKTFTLAPPNPEWTRMFVTNNLPSGGGALDPSRDVMACARADDWGLSYDDGPSNLTPMLLDELRKRNIKATFFVVGSNVVSNPSILQRAYREGHTIGIHTWSHPYLSQTSSEQVVSEILYTARAVQQVIGVTPRFVRPPYGDYDNRIRALIANMGMNVVVWNTDTKDGMSQAQAEAAPAFIREKVTQVRNGPISLQHDIFEYQVRQNLQTLDLIIGAKFNLKTIDQCTGLSPYSNAVWTGNVPRPPPPPPVPSGQPLSIAFTATVTIPAVTAATELLASPTATLTFAAVTPTPTSAAQSVAGGFAASVVAAMGGMAALALAGVF